MHNLLSTLVPEQTLLQMPHWRMLSETRDSQPSAGLLEGYRVMVSVGAHEEIEQSTTTTEEAYLLQSRYPGTQAPTQIELTHDG